MSIFGNPHIRHDETDAEFCRRMGWNIGTFLVGEEGYGPTAIKLTAVGEESILARQVSHCGDTRENVETSWSLDCRNWSPVAGPQIYYGA